MLYYKAGYTYQLAKTVWRHTEIITGADHKTDFVSLGANGLLIIVAGYAWDGASGPVIQSPDTMRASLFHDALYQLIRLGHIGVIWRDTADKLYRQICIDAGMPHPRAQAHYMALKAFGGYASLIEAEPKLLVAP